MNRSRFAAAPSLACLAALAACGGSHSAQPPVSSIALPSGAALKAWDPTKVNLAFPAGMAATSSSQIYVALENLDPATYAPNGPGLLVGFNPYTGSSTVIDLAVATASAPAEHSCSSSGVVKADAGQLYVACGGNYNVPTGPDRALVVVDSGSNAVTHTVAMPSGFLPDALALTSTRIWLGNSAGPSLASVDRTALALYNGSGSQPLVAVNCTDQTYGYISDAAVYGGDLYVLCGSNTSGEIVRLDAATGAFKDKALVGAQPVKMTQLADGRIAVVNSVSGTVSFVTIATPLSVAKDAILVNAGADLEGVAFLDHYLFTVSSATQTVQKIDLSAAGGPKIVAEVNTGNGSGPLSIVPLDDSHAMVSASLTGKIVGATFP